MKRLFTAFFALCLLTSTAFADHTTNPYSITPTATAIIEPCTDFQFVSGNTGGPGGGAVEFDHYEFEAQSGTAYTFSNDPADGGATTIASPWKSIHLKSTGALQGSTFVNTPALNWTATASDTFAVKQHNDSINGDYTLAYRGDGIACASAVPSAATWSLVLTGMLIMLLGVGRVSRV